MVTERKKPATHTAQNSRKNRQRNILWFNPPYSMNIQTNIGREFLNLVDKHFPKNHRYNKIFNKNNIKVSYSCTDNLQTIIKKHNRKILETSKKPSTENNCNCRKKTTARRKTTASPQASSTMPTKLQKVTQSERITSDKRKELLSNVTRNTNFLFGTETIQTARNYQNISGH